MPGYSILVNTSDGYEDCWEPFLRLLRQHWPDCRAPVFLNTERKEWRSASMPVTCLRVQPADAPRLSWSQCLDAALARIPTPLVLYFHEDYFISRRVDGATIDELAALMQSDAGIRHIGLTHFGAMGPFAPTDDPRLWTIARNARYRISTQAGLWRVETLRSHLRPDENAWMFEIFGSLRARRRDERFLTVNRDRYGPGHRIVDYIHTGIIKGRWHPDIPAQFRDAGIEMDFARRGIYRHPPAWLRKLETASMLLRKPGGWLRALLHDG